MPRDRLRRLISAQTEATPRLPLVHNTDVYSLVNILEDTFITPQACDVFVGEPLLYLFYGRPSYRVNSNELPSSLSHFLPVCLIFKSTSQLPIKRIFPFDSGAFGNDFYNNALHPNMKLDDFGLEPDPSTSGKVISLFFGSVDNYLNARPTQSPQLDSAQLEANSYHALISQRLSNSVDNRVSGIEIQCEGTQMISGNVEAIVLPGPIYESERVSSYLTNLGILGLPYTQIDRQRPSEYVSKIFDVVYEYYRRSNLI